MEKYEKIEHKLDEKCSVEEVKYLDFRIKQNEMNFANDERLMDRRPTGISKPVYRDRLCSKHETELSYLLVLVG